MANRDDQLLGATIRRRRESAGISQKDFAATAGMAAVVMGRIEMGTRSVRATELLAIATALDTTADALLRSVTPATSEELLERAEYRRDAVVSALREYAEALVAVMTAVGSSPAMTEDGALDTPAAVREHLARTPGYVPVSMRAALAPEVRAALDAARDSLELVSPRGVPMNMNRPFGEVLAELEAEKADG